MKLVIDVNVLVSGSLWRGSPALLVDAVLKGAATLCTSPAILKEFEEVLQRAKFQKRLKDRGSSAAEIVSQFRATALTVESRTIALPLGLRDPDDVHILSCAIAVRADAIVSGDDHVLSLGAFEGIPILTARQALEKLGIAGS